MFLSIGTIRWKCAHLIHKFLTVLLLFRISQSFLVSPRPHSRFVHHVFYSSPLTYSEDFSDELKQDGNDPRQEQQLIQGWITKRRLMGASLAFLAIQMDDNNDSTPLVLRREYYQNHEVDFAVACKIMQPGVVAQFQGYFANNRGEEQFIVTAVSYLRPNNNPQHLCYILRLIRDGKLNPSPIAEALSMAPSELHDRIVYRAQTATSENPMYILAKELLSNMTGLLDPFKFVGSTKKTKVSLLPLVPREYATIADSLLQNTTDVGNVVTLVGQIRSRIRFQGSITQVTLAVTEDNESDNQTLTRVILHPQSMEGNATMYGNICSRGAIIGLTGCWQKINNDMIFWVKETPQVIRASSHLGSVKYFVELIHQGHIDRETGSRALQVPMNVVENIIDTHEHTKRMWKAAEIAKELQLADERDNSSGRNMNPDVLEKYETLRETYPIFESKCAITKTALTPTLFEANRIAATGSRWNRAKRPQLDWMLEQVCEILESNSKYGREPIQIIDVGGGKGYLANLIAEVFGDSVKVGVVDISAAAVRNGMMRSRKRSVTNIEFQVADATSVDLGNVDIVVALHACGVLTDVALGHAVSKGASFVVCPCCYLSNRRLKIPVTDKRISVGEWLGVSTSDLENLQHIAELQGSPWRSTMAAHTINALRIAACSMHLSSMPGRLEIQLKSFPIGYSLRNMGIIGQYVQ